jgi:hypothetical protein
VDRFVRFRSRENSPRRAGAVVTTSPVVTIGVAGAAGALAGGVSAWAVAAMNKPADARNSFLI